MTALDVSHLPPVDLARYLAATGWLEDYHEPDVSVWTVGAGENGFEVLVPFNDGFRDYEVRLREALRTVALAEDRHPETVLADVLSVAVDSQHFRLLPATPVGTLPLAAIIDVARGVRDLMYAAAHSATIDEPLLVQPRTRPPEVHRFVRAVRVAAPTAGSFVFTAQVPLLADTGSSMGLPPEVPFHRRVVLKLHGAAGAVHAAAGEAVGRDSVQPFAERAADGVSADLCAAVGLIGAAQPFELRFAWAQSAPLTLDTAQYSFDRPRLDAIRRAAQELPRLAEQGEVVVVGRVIRLERLGAEGGTVTLRGGLERTPGYVSDVNLTAALPADLYALAVQAHQDRRRIRVTGHLRGNELERVRLLEII